MTFFDRCRTALAQGIAVLHLAVGPSQWVRVRREVQLEGGSCNPTTISTKEQTLQACMKSPKVNQVALCLFDSDMFNLFTIEEEEKTIKKNEDIIQARQELIKAKIQEHQKFMKEAQEFIKKKQENIKDSEDVLDMRKQNIVFLKQIFEGP